MRYALILLGTLYIASPSAQSLNNNILSDPKDLPFGMFPNISAVQDTETSNNNLKDDVKGLGVAVKETVQTFAARRNFNCLGSPCLVQAFPLLYSKPNSGFFGGFRTSIRDITRQDPPIYGLNFQIIRSDNNQWVSFANLDFPRIDFLPLRPRIKMRAGFSHTSETRFFGIGSDAENSLNRDDQELRFRLQENSFQTALIVPVFNVEAHRISLFGAFEVSDVRPSRYQAISKLFEDHPLGVEGGQSAALGLGLLVDSRDREVYPRQGWGLEIAGSVAGNPLGQYPFQRFTIVDRRYYSYGKNTLAFRSTIDGLTGEVPFWELEKVGGIDPLRDISGSGILRGYTSGRFHERFKALESTEYRRYFNPRRLFGQYTEIIWIPIALDFGRLGEQNAFSLSSGIDLFFNRSFLLRFYATRADTGAGVVLGFDQEF